MARLIDADELLLSFPDKYPGKVRPAKPLRNLYPVNLVRREIMEAPTVDPIKRGHWIQVDKNFSYPVKCSICGEEDWYGVFNYCPNCGAKMDEVTE